MPVVIEREEFTRVARIYVSRLLKGLCENEVTMAADPQRHTVRIVAKLSQVDFQAIKFSDVYVSIQKVVKRLGERHLDPATQQPHSAEFKLYDPYFENLEFQPEEEGMG